jgi:heat-inducible transcriptional repressor
MARKASKSTTPAPNAAPVLDARKAAILNAVVTEYVDTAQPVGSNSVAAHQRVAVSPATVRSEMVALEREGLLTQPHTSAGRIPTDLGYRYFVDHLQRGVLEPAQQIEIGQFFSNVRGEIEDVLEQTSALLSRLTKYTSVVVGPSHARATIRTAQIIDFGPRRVLIVGVLSDGAIEKRTIDLDDDVSALDVAEASAQLQGLLVGASLDQRVEVPARNHPIANLVRLGASALLTGATSIDGDRVFIGGSSKVAESFDAVDTVRNVLGILEQELVVVTLMQDIMDQGLSVAIGSEHGYDLLSACAVVVAPVSVDGVQAGAVGLLGPTRMNYREALAAAQVVSQRLTERFGSHESARG